VRAYRRSCLAPGGLIAGEKAGHSPGRGLGRKHCVILSARSRKARTKGLSGTKSRASAPTTPAAQAGLGAMPGEKRRRASRHEIHQLSKKGRSCAFGITARPRRAKRAPLTGRAGTAAAGAGPFAVQNSSRAHMGGREEPPAPRHPSGAPATSSSPSLDSSCSPDERCARLPSLEAVPVAARLWLPSRTQGWRRASSGDRR